MVTGAIIFGIGVLVGLVGPVGVAKLKELLIKA